MTIHSSIFDLNVSNLKRCPRCNKHDLTILNLFTVKSILERGYVDFFCPHCMALVVKDPEGRIIQVSKFQNKKASTVCFINTKKELPFTAFLIKRSDLHGRS